MWGAPKKCDAPHNETPNLDLAILVFYYAEHLRDYSEAGFGKDNAGGWFIGEPCTCCTDWHFRPVDREERHVLLRQYRVATMMFDPTARPDIPFGDKKTRRSLRMYAGSNMQGHYLTKAVEDLIKKLPDSPESVCEELDRVSRFLALNFYRLLRERRDRIEEHHRVHHVKDANGRSHVRLVDPHVEIVPVMPDEPINIVPISRARSFRGPYEYEPGNVS